jgi:hypothetical protein
MRCDKRASRRKDAEGIPPLRINDQPSDDYDEQDEEPAFLTDAVSCKGAQDGKRI